MSKLADCTVSYLFVCVDRLHGHEVAVDGCIMSLSECFMGFVVFFESRLRRTYIITICLLLLSQFRVLEST